MVAVSRTAWAQPADTPTGTLPPAEEKPPADEQKRHEAKQHFMRGLELVQNEDWDAALAEFLASRELFPTQVALKNAAISLRQLKRYADALEMYRELLAQFGASLSAQDRKIVDDAVAQLAIHVGRLDITAKQAACTVVVDGQPRGTTPFAKPLEVNAGTHTLRVSKSGYQMFETQVLVAGNQTKSVVADLVALTAAGTLNVSEVEGKPVRVVVDGAVVGQAPWTGTVAPGTHAVFLIGEGDFGTPPSSALVPNGGTATLRLRATRLDSLLRIEPTPSSAQVNVDGVAVGNGVWEGRLKSGTHRIEIAAEGFIADRRDVTTRPGPPSLARISLERDLSSPIWRGGFVPHIYLEAVAGPAWAPGFGGGADSACSQAGCDRSRPLGFLAGARGGYELTRGLGVELFLGALYMKEKTQRTLVASGENGDWRATDYHDSTELFGPAAAVSASYRFFEKTPLTFRVWAGAARVNASYSNQGTFTGQVAYQPPTGPKETASSTQSVSIPEKNAHVWMPFVGPEVRFGRQLGKRFSLDFGIALLLSFPPDSPRTGLTDLSRAEGDRKTGMRDVTLPSGNLARGGVLSLPRENGFGTFYVLLPTLAGRFDL